MFKWIKDKFSSESNEEKSIDLEEEQKVVDDSDEGSVSDEKEKSEEEISEDFVEDTEEYITKEEDPTVSLDPDEGLAESEIDSSTEDISETLDEQPAEEKGFFAKIFGGLERTRDNISNKLDMILGSYVSIDDDMYEDLEDILITADIGVNTTITLIDNLKNRIREDKVTDPNLVVDLLADETKKLLNNEEIRKFDPTKVPTVILVVGVNGVGKTTSIGKLAAQYKSMGNKVMVVAADTFRAAATEQLKEWANRAGVDIISQHEGADPAAIVYDAMEAAKSRQTDIVLVDTAGRLHNKANLMNELEKIYNVINRQYPEANKESLIVLDATTGQNAINQAKEFKNVVDVSGIVLTKLDGTAKGGMVLPLIHELELPVEYIGVGEQINDLQEFDVDTFVDSIFDIKN